MKMGDGCNTSLEENSRADEQKTGTLTRNWFASLSRRSKPRPTSPDDLPGRSIDSSISPKNDKNIFQRILKQVEKKFSGCRTKFGGASELIQNRAMEFSLDDFEKCSKAGVNARAAPVMEGDELRKYLAKKWLEKDTGPDIVMFNACSEMLSHAWYWGQISRFEAQRQLTDKPNGSFLIRDSEKDGPQFTLSFRMWDRTLHYRIQYYDNYWHFEERKYQSMVNMVENFMLRSADEIFVCFVQRSCVMPPYPVILCYPISRYSKMTTLQELCRRVIQRNMKQEEIRKLPIPTTLKEYLAEEIVGRIF